MIAVDQVEPVAPLDGQFGVWPLLSVPEPLLSHLFPGGDQKSYAILDAGEIPGLPERLETSDLDYHCLYKGEMAQDLRDDAPYLVQLKPDHWLTRALMTDDGGPTGWWPLDYGMFVVSCADLGSLVAHFRKFTSVWVKGADKRMYLRFWSAATMLPLARSGQSDPLALRLVADHTLIVRETSPLWPSRALILKKQDTT